MELCTNSQTVDPPGLKPLVGRSDPKSPRLDGSDVAPADPPHPRRALSEREKRMLRLVCEGLTNRQIGLALGISAKTVKTELTALFRKLDVTTRSEATARFTD